MKYEFTSIKDALSRDELSFFGTLLLILIFFLIFRYTNLSYYISINNLKVLKPWIEESGFTGYVVFIVVIVLGGLSGIPALPLKFLGGLIFTPIISTILITFGSVISSTIAFLISRYGMRAFAENLIKKNKKLQKIYMGFEDNGWKMLMITRLVPIFPYNLQNFVYGVTNIDLGTFLVASIVFMLPANICISYIAHAVSNGGNALPFLVLYFLIIASVGTITILKPKGKEAFALNKKNPLK